MWGKITYSIKWFIEIIQLICTIILTTRLFNNKKLLSLVPVKVCTTEHFKQIAV